MFEKIAMLLLISTALCACGKETEIENVISENSVEAVETTDLQQPVELVLETQWTIRNPLDETVEQAESDWVAELGLSEEYSAFESLLRGDTSVLPEEERNQIEISFVIEDANKDNIVFFDVSEDGIQEMIYLHPQSNDREVQSVFQLTGDGCTLLYEDYGEARFFTILGDYGLVDCYYNTREGYLYVYAPLKIEADQEGLVASNKKLMLEVATKSCCEKQEFGDVVYDTPGVYYSIIEGDTKTLLEKEKWIQLFEEEIGTYEVYRNMDEDTIDLNE